LSLFGVKLVAGGAKWFDQNRRRRGEDPPEASHVIVHDAARPAVAYSDIDCIMETAEKHPAVALTAPLRTNLVELDEGHQPVAYHLSNRFVQLLTPQVFSKEKFAEMAKSKAGRARQQPSPGERHAAERPRRRLG
jgi:2-C-methyl-D-erythritol 4-phosphate cytidylyltransferase